MADKDPQDADIVKAIGADPADPQILIDQLEETYEFSCVIEALQRAIERGRIIINSDGMVVVVQELADAA